MRDWGDISSQRWGVIAEVLREETAERLDEN